MYRMIQILAVLAVLATSISSAFGQEDCRVYVRKVVDGAVMVVCADRATPRVISATATAAATLDARRGTSTVTSPWVASTNATPAYGWGVPAGYGGWEYGYPPPPPPDYQMAWELRDALLLGVQVTSFEAEARAAADRGIRDGEHQAVLDAIASLRDQIAGSERRLRAAIAIGDERLEREIATQKASLERELEEKLASASSPAPGSAGPASSTSAGGTTGSTSTPAPSATSGGEHLVADPAVCEAVDEKYNPDKCRIQLNQVGKK